MAPSAKVVLPEPDSPTSPTASPGADVQADVPHGGQVSFLGAVGDRQALGGEGRRRRTAAAPAAPRRQRRRALAGRAAACSGRPSSAALDPGGLNT